MLSLGDDNRSLVEDIMQPQMERCWPDYAGIVAAAATSSSAVTTGKRSNGPAKKPYWLTAALRNRLIAMIHRRRVCRWFQKLRWSVLVFYTHERYHPLPER